MHWLDNYGKRCTQTRSLLLIAAASVAMSGCYKATFVQPKTAAGVERDEWTDFFVFGLVGEEQRDIGMYCEGPVARVRTGGNFATGLVSFVTIGIYTPRKVYVTCVDEEATSALRSTATPGSQP
jgi:hypothetical protein